MLWVKWLSYLIFLKINIDTFSFLFFFFSSVTNTPLLVAVAVIGVLCIVGMSYMVFQQKRSKYSQHVTVPSEEEMWEVSRHSEGFFILQLTRVNCEWKACNWSRQFLVSLMMYRLLRMENKYWYWKGVPWHFSSSSESWSCEKATKYTGSLSLSKSCDH